MKETLHIQRDSAIQRLAGTLSFLWAVLATNMRVHKPEWKKLVIMSFFMMVQNSLFFSLWVILFASVKSLHGWGLADVARMYGVIASAVGASLFFFNGARTIAYRIHDGTLDGFLTKPRAVLPHLLLSSSSPASLGDILYGPLIWTVLGSIGWGEVPFLLLMTLVATVIFTSLTVVIFSLAFWLKGTTRFSEQMFLMLIIFSSVQQHGQPFWVQLIMYTVMPAAFITYWPTLLSMRFDPIMFAGLMAALAVYGWLAVRIFHAGLRRYQSAQTDG